MIRAAVGALLMAAAAGSAQAQTRIPGRVIDPEQRPVANVEVLLHAVTEQAGSQVDKDTSKADGSFELVITTPVPNALYFVAVTHNGELYMGEMMREPFPRDQEYVVQVGVNPVNLGPPPVTGELPPAQTSDSRTAGLVVILVAAAAIGTVIIFALRRRPPVHRRWLVELARIEDDLATGGADRDILLKRRAELRARLLTPKSG